MAYQQGVPIEIHDTFYVDGVETNPSAVNYSILEPDGDITTYTWPGDPEIANPGIGEFVLSLSPPSLPGLYQYDVDATGTVVASRTGSFYVIPNSSSVNDVDWAVPGPCTPWVSSQSVWNCCGQPTTTIDGVVCNVDFSSEAMEASQVLFELSGRRFAGACERTVRPCALNDWCGFQVLSRGHIVGWGGASWNGRSCGCRPLSRVKLSGYPVREITEVLIDGAVVDPDTYRLDERRYLTRVRDPADPDTVLLWPSCQALDLPDTEDGTFSVTYRYGMDPPLIGMDAAAELACELYKACNSGAGECNLPSSVTRIVRAGITIDRDGLSAWGLQNGIWRTGLTRVDTFLNAANPTRISRRPSVYSPDVPGFARPVGT